MLCNLQSHSQDTRYNRIQWLASDLPDNQIGYNRVNDQTPEF